MSETDQERRTRLLTKAYGAATARLRAEHKVEFEDFYVQEAATLGVEYTPRLSAEQKAEELIREQFERYPELKNRFIGDQ